MPDFEEVKRDIAGVLDSISPLASVNERDDAAEKMAILGLDGEEALKYLKLRAIFQVVTASDVIPPDILEMNDKTLRMFWRFVEMQAEDSADIDHPEIWALGFVMGMSLGYLYRKDAEHDGTE